MPRLTSELVVRLLDGVTKPAQAAARAIAGIGRAQDGVNRGSFGSRIADATKAAERNMDALRGKMVDAIGTGYLLKQALTAPLRAAAGFETVLEDMGQKADIPQNKLQAFGKQIQEVARATNQGTMQIASAIDNLLGMGASQQVALAAAAPIGKAATAYRAATDDLAKASWAAVDNLKVPAAEIGRSLDMMAEAGKQGAFELRDMAQYFPSLGAAYQGLGQTGTKSVADLAAALQVVRKGTGDASTAATNLQNVLQKVYAPATIKKFAELGVNIRKEMKKAAKAGQTPIEAIANITNKVLKGDLSRLGEVFEDAQVQGGIRSLIQNMEEYRRIRAQAMGAKGTVDTDFARRIRTAQGAMDRMAAASENLNIAIGSALAPAFADLLDSLVPVANAVSRFAEANPVLTRNVVAATAALIGFRVAAVGLQFATGISRLSLLQFGGAVVGLGAQLRTAGAAALAFTLAPIVASAGAAQRAMLGFIGAARLAGVAEASKIAVAGIGASFLGLLSPIRIVTGAMRVMKLALIGTGVGAVLVGLAVAGTWIYNNWKGISTAFEAFKGAFSRAIDPIRPAIQPVIDIFGKVGEVFASLTGQVDPLGGKWAALGIAIGDKLGGALVAVVNAGKEAVAFLLGMPAQLASLQWGEITAGLIAQFLALPLRLVQIPAEILAIFTGIDLTGAAAAMIAGFVETVKAKLGEMAGWVKSKLRDMFTFNVSMPSWLGGGGGAAAPASAAPAAPALDGERAKGGPVRRGGRYLVGENEPEIFEPGASGFITPMSKMAGNSNAKPAANTNRGSFTYAPSYQISQVQGVAELQAVLTKHDEDAMRQFESYSDGAFADS